MLVELDEISNNVKVMERFKRKILAKLRSDKVVKYCLKDGNIVLIGKKIYQKYFMKKDKQVEHHCTVKDHMRLLARLHIIFRDQKVGSTPNGNLMHIYIWVNLDFLYDVYDQLTVNEMNKFKPGLATNLYDVLIFAANTLRYYHYENGKDDTASGIEKFQ